MKEFKIKVFAHFKKGGARTKDVSANVWATDETIASVAIAKAKTVFKGSKYTHHGFSLD